MDSKKALKGALFASFLICLYVSIPHLAWTFHSWNTGVQDTPFTFGVGGWTILSTTQEWFNSYLEAMAIDIAIAFMSVTLTNSKNRQHMGIGYTFISFLIAISWLFNWIYANAHAPMNAGIWTDSILGVSIFNLSSIIASALPVLALAFTIMIDKLTGEKITPAQLKTMADEMEQLNVQKARMKALKKGKTTEAVNEQVDNVFAIAKNIGNKMPKRVKKVKQVPLVETPETPVKEQTTDELEAINMETSAASLTTPEDNQVPLVEAINNEDKTPTWDSLGSRATVPIETASSLLGISIKGVRSLRSKGALKSAARNANLITMSSLRAYEETRQKRKQQPITEENKPALSIVRSSDEITDNEESIEDGIAEEIEA